MSSVCGPTVGEIRRATEHLRRSEFSEAVEVLGDRAPSSVVSESLALAARGCLHEGQGEVEEAAECFDRVYELGVPLLPLLHQCGRYFKRVGQYKRAYHCYSLCWHVTPWVIHEFLDELPSREMRLYAPFLIAARPGSEPPAGEVCARTGARRRTGSRCLRGDGGVRAGLHGETHADGRASRLREATRRTTRSSSALETSSFRRLPSSPPRMRPAVSPRDRGRCSCAGL